MGLIRQKDFAWQDQTGAPADPQAGNIPGGHRDVLRSADFNNAQGNLQATGFFADSGTWEAQGARLQISAESPRDDAVSVFHVNSYLPNYFEIQATMQSIKPTGGWKANAYVVFDYQSSTDFKFAGLDVSNNKIVIGHKAPWGWAVDAFRNKQLKPDVFYNVLVSINGTNVTVVVDGQTSFTHTFAPRIIDGLTYGLNQGMVGFGSDSARGSLDNIAVQVLPPRVTLQTTENFDDDVANLFTGPKVGAWQVSAGVNKRYVGTPDAGSDRALSLIDLRIGRGLRTSAYLELSTNVKTQTAAGFVFDWYGPNDFKYATIDAQAGAVVVGHRSPRGGWVVDATVARTVVPGADYVLGLTLKGTTISVTLNGALAVSHAFNAVAVDGGFGYLARGGQASFDEFTLKTDDPAFPGPNGLMAATPAAPTGGARVVRPATLAPLVKEAVRRWAAVDMRARALDGRLQIVIADLPGQLLGQADGLTVYIDRDAAGHGWFIDPTPRTDAEFVRPGNQGERGRMDLLTVAMHEVGHVLGYDHGGNGLMSETLRTGSRFNPTPGVSALTPSDGSAPVAGTPADRSAAPRVAVRVAAARAGILALPSVLEPRQQVDWDVVILDGPALPRVGVQEEGVV